LMGAFSDNQSAYAERGIATFPLNDNKKPYVSNYQKMGLPASSRLAGRFRHANGIGFMTNARSRVAVLDVDTTDENVLADAMNRHGSTPIIARTASGKFHALYKHNGEYRKIRPFGDLPIDLLGIGGLAVAVPSRFEKGEYAFIQGSLDDVERLPVMRGLDPAMYRPRDTTIAVATPTFVEGAFDRGLIAEEGVRNTKLWEYSMQQMAEKQMDFDTLVDLARNRNATYSPPMPDEEVIRVATSAWGYTVTGRNWFGSSGKVVTSTEDIDEMLVEAPDAFLLLVKLRRHNWGATFIVANALATSMGWDTERFIAARKELERKGKLVRIRKGNRFQGASVFAWPNHDYLTARGGRAGRQSKRKRVFSYYSIGNSRC
jgi:hypothetical protein